MDKLRFNITITLDGYIAGPNHSTDEIRASVRS